MEAQTLTLGDQLRKQHFETIKAYMDNMPIDDNGHKIFNGEEFARIQAAFDNCIGPITITKESPHG